MGQTSGSVAGRFRQHKMNAKQGKVRYGVYHWMRKHGIDNIAHRVLEQVPIEAIDAAEIEWIVSLRSMGFDLLNHSSGGAGQRGFKHSEESRAKMSATKIGMFVGEKNGMWGKPKSPEVREKISASKTGVPWSEKRRAVAKPIRGESNVTAKLTEAQVREIHARANAGETGHALGREYGIGQSSVSRIKNKQAWLHIWEKP